MIQPEDHGIGFALKCAHCGETLLHHDEVIVFERREDALDGTRVTVSGVDQADDDTVLRARVTVDSSMFGNPSARRHGVRVGFWCELCGQRSALSIAQHKGETYLECVRSVGALEAG